MLEGLLDKLVAARVPVRIERRRAASPAPGGAARATRRLRADPRAAARPSSRPAGASASRLAAVGIQITPSILNADFSRLGDEVARIGSADWVHVDVMDNHFVPNLTFGPTMVEALTHRTDVPLDAHLMIDDPDSNAIEYVEAGCGSVTFHVEAARAPVRLAREIRAKGARAAMALKPATPIEPYEELLAELDMVLVMTVEPGFGGQKFLDLCLPKIRTARQLIEKHGGETWLQVDGGVSLETIERCAEAGADVFVAGSAVYSADDPDRMVAELRGRAERRLA